MQQFASTHALRDKIIGQLAQNGLDQDGYTEMLDYTIDLFESQGLGTDYYGYHNITHELEVTYVTLLAASCGGIENGLSHYDLKHLYVAALFHDFDPQKNVDKPHEESVIRFISLDKKLQQLLKQSELDLEIIKSLIYRTTFPWTGKLKEDAEERIQECFSKSYITRDDKTKQEHYRRLGWYLSVLDRVAGYSLGDFLKAMEMAKMNAHASAWHPALIIRKAVAYFEHIINEESQLLQQIMGSLPKEMRRNFMNTVMSFFKLRQHEIQVQADYLYENLRIVATIEKPSTRQNPEFIATLFAIYNELPKPLQFGREKFEESVRDPNTILNTIRLGDSGGEIIGFAKGGALESYELRPEIRDENYGLKNTVFLEPLALKMGYWGLRGGSEMRDMFTMQAHAKKFTYLTSFALRDVIRKRVESNENAEFVTLFDPERWDYYRIRL